MGLAFLIAFAAFLINGHQRRAPDAGAVQDAPESDAPLLDKGPLIMAGIAAGLAASVKLTFLIPVGAIAVGVVLFSGRGRRLTTAWVMGLSMFVVGGYWYLRAAIKTGGNPIPQIELRAAAPADARPDAARPAAALRRRPLPHRPDDLPQVVLPPARQRARPALAADPDRRRRRRGLHRRPLAQQDPAGARRRRPADRGRLRLHAAHRGRPGGLADRVLHQHPLPDAGPGAGDGAAADRAAAAGARQARLADAALPHRGLRDHGADDAALVPGLHRRHGLPHPGAGLGAGGARPAARRAAGQPRPVVAAAARGGPAAGGGARPRAGGPVRRPPLHRSRRSSSRTAGRRRPTRSPAASTTSGSGSPARARSSSASTASTAPTSTTTSSTSACPGPHGAYRLADQLPPVPPPDQRRRLRLPDHQPVHAGRARRALPVPDLRLGENRPGAEADHRRARHHARARLRLQGQRQARPRPAAQLGKS